MKSKFNILIWMGIPMFFFSCSIDKDLITEIETQVPKTISNRHVSSKQAKAFSQLMANSLFSSEDGPKLKSSTAKAYRNSEDINPIVFNGKDTVMYSVNFGNELGFMIISADKQSFPIIAYVDSGAFDLNLLDKNSPLKAWFEVKSEIIANNIYEDIDTADNGYQLWESLNNDSTEIEIEFASLPRLPSTVRGTREYSTGKPTIYPFTGQHYQWGQGAGYNFNAPLQGAPAGCPAVAVGQLFIHHWFPYQFGYMYMPNKLPLNYNQQNAISLMFRSIADAIPGYSFTSTVSGANGWDILTGIRSFGYSRARYIGYNFETLYSNFSSGNPVLLGAFSSSFGGHIWFTDGYHEFSWIIRQYRTNIFGKRKLIREWTEYADYIYMNWGWDGIANGWYEQNTWAPENRGINFNIQKMMYVDLYPVYN